MEETNKIKFQFVILVLIAIFLVTFVFIFPKAAAFGQGGYVPGRPDNGNKEMTKEYVMVNPEEAFEEDPKKAVKLYPNILNDFLIADRYFTQNPSESAVYQEKAMAYLLKISRTGEFSNEQEKVLKQYLQATGFSTEENIELGEAYFVDGQSIMDLPVIFSDFMRAKGVAIKMPVSLAKIDFTPPGRIFAVNGDADIINLRKKFSFEMTPEGRLELIDKTKTRHTFSGSLETDPNGKIFLAEGMIDSLKIKGGAEISIDGNKINGKFKRIGKLTFSEPQFAIYDSKTEEVLVSKGTKITAIEGGKVIVKGENIRFPSYPQGWIFKGAVEFKDGVPFIVKTGSSVSANGFLHNVDKGDLYLERTSGKNYFVFEKVNAGGMNTYRIEASGMGFTSLINGNKEFPLPPANLNLPFAELSGLTIDSNVGIALNGPRPGTVQIMRVSAEGEPLKLFSKADGYFTIINGNMKAGFSDITLPTGRKQSVFDVDYERPEDANNILTAVDMRIEHLDNGEIRTYDMNIDYAKIRALNPEEKTRLRRELMSLMMSFRS